MLLQWDSANFLALKRIKGIPDMLVLKFRQEKSAIQILYDVI